ncbi:uncharacterized protein PHACADRAFT_99581 [Phanerochaete carnosa HHB-10118-sp]|uniref:PARP catalytic domain-containing protein n=1 Tax=Phanerochaete carnosa (strain HHB-10118-sp) TaxID=650164 RepID=K5VNF2_PHACS|nr:uncharacterized protein PHACADRAFT_99581 [Phanerochaete carnosa HHB-10118-sp]EKM52988.1 hypothetical protein PHACADRAFT_99581 [Phanerochaete carnosa HHB-10118-sp]
MRVYSSISQNAVLRTFTRKRVGNEQKLWHGTIRQCKLGDDGRNLRPCGDPQCALCQIISTSYQKKFSDSRGRYGKGIYSSTTSSKAAGYSKNGQPSEYKAMLLNNVVVGRTHETNDAMSRATSPPKGYDSVCGLPSDGGLKFDETCVYDDDAIRPVYLVLYDAKA